MFVSTFLRNRSSAAIESKLNEALSLLLKFKPNEKYKSLDKLSFAQKYGLCESLIQEQVFDSFAKLGKGKLDYKLETRKSLVKHEEAGKGVFVSSGSIKKGQVCALYPGNVICPSLMSTIDEKYLNTSKLSQRPDEFIIEAANEPTKYLNFAHMINHPPKTYKPNVMLLYYTFPKEEKEDNSLMKKVFNISINSPFSKKQVLPDGFSKYIGNRYFENKEPSVNDVIKIQQFSALKLGEIFMPTLVTIAMEDISRNEELYLDYHYDPEVEQPSWYHHIDIEKDRMIYKEPESFFNRFFSK